MKVDAVTILKDYTVEVEIRRVKQARFRLWLAFQIMRLAVWIGNMGLSKKEFVGVIVEDESIIA